MRLTLAILATAISTSSLAQTAEQDERVVVTATRNPLPGRELGASVIVIQRSEIETSGAQTVGEILRGLPGLAVRRNGGAGANTEVFIRGDKGGHTMVMVDGVELADVSSIEKNFDIGDMPLFDVERIEIVKGPHSVVYGSSGLSGVIHIITRRPEAGARGEVGLLIGSYETYGVHGRVGGKVGSFGYAAAVSGSTSEGYSNNGSRDDGEADGYTRSDASLRFQYAADSAYNADLFLKGAHSLAEIDGGTSTDDPNFTVKREDISALLNQKLRFAEIFETRLAAGITQSDRRFFDDPDAQNPDRNATWERSRFEGEHRTLDLSQQINLAKDHTLIATAQWIKDEATIANKASYQGYDVDDKLPEMKTRERSYGLQYQWGFWDRVYGQWGVRTLDNSDFGKKTVGQAAFNFALIPEFTTIRLNIGRGFKTPSLYQRFAPIYGNAELNPEFVHSAEAGVEQKFGPSLTATVTGFQNKTDNLIEFDGETSRYYNVNRALIKGVETTLAWDINEAFRTQAQYTSITTLDRQTNHALPSRPDETWSGDVTWKHEGFSWMTAVRGQNRSRPGSYVADTDGFYVVDTSLSLTRGAMRYGFKVGNLFNSWYQEVAGYNTPARNYQLTSDVSF